MIIRKKTKKVKVGNIYVGGNAPISIQAMTNSDTAEINETLKQIHMLENVGCEIIRVAVNNRCAAEAIKEIKKEISIPLVADIHYDYRLAIKAIENGADKIRINPGNLNSEAEWDKIIELAKEKEVAIRLGINAGCMEHKYKKADVTSLVKSTLDYCEYFEKRNCENLVLALKSSDVTTCIEAYRRISEITEFPLHIGVTETGVGTESLVKSTLGIGTLLAEGIGDTIRVSTTGNILEQVNIGKYILKGLGIRRDGIEFISCPMCGRCKVNSQEIAEKVYQQLKGYEKNIKIAIMGCSVNGPGEAKAADIGIAGAANDFVLFKKGEIVGRIGREYVVDKFVEEVKKIEI